MDSTQGGGCYIADEMGLGKTLQAIGVINCIPEIRRVLVVTKASLKENWRRELEKWLVDKLTIGIAEAQYWPRNADVVIINYDVLTKHTHSLRAAEWDLVILDESANIKNRTTKRAMAVIGYVPTKKAQAAGEQIIPPLPAKRRIALSGTPIENRPEEIWSTLFFLDPKRWRSFWSFAKRYCAMNQDSGHLDTSGASNLEELQRILRETCMIRRLKKDVLKELPPKTRGVVEMNTEGMEEIIEQDRKAYQRHEQALIAAQAELEVARASDSDTAFKEAVKKMASTHVAFTEIAKVRHDTAVAKVPAMIPMLQDELEECSKILVFGHHRDVLEPLHKAFPGSVLITGETPPEERQGICDRFQTDPKCRQFFGSIRACGEGLTLTAANLVVFAEQDWAPGKMSQAEDRAHRIGQKDNVLVKHYVIPGTMDAKMIKTTIEKQEIIEAALDIDPGAWAAEPVFAPAKPLGKRTEIQEEGLLMTSTEIAAAHNGLRQLALYCDGAQALDGAGFSKVDTTIGHQLAARGNLTPGQAALGRRLCVRYQRQLSPEVLKAMGVRAKPENEAAQ